MITPFDNDKRAVQQAARELKLVRTQTSEARVVLARLQEKMAALEDKLNSSRATHIVKANEQLVLAMLRSQNDAEAAAQTLKQAQHAVHCDALTGLPNRLLLLDRFSQAIVGAKRHGARLALLCLDLNNFKQINDTLGYTVGDDVLKWVAQDLVASVREADTVSRQGGDEFLILLTEISKPSDAALIAEKIVARLGTPSRVGDHVLRLTASFGISIYNDDGEDPITLIERADSAMYRAKTHGPSTYIFYQDALANKQRPEFLTLDSLKRPVTHHGDSLAEQDQRNAQLREANEQLVLAALSAQELQVAAEQSHRKQKELIALVAHELRDPLTPIRMAAQMLSQDKIDVIPRMQAIIERQVVHISRLVDDLLDVSRVNTGKLRLLPQMVDLAGIIDEALDTCRLAMDTRLQRFGIHVPSCALPVYADPVRLVQVLSNLLSNASKYTPPGGEIGLAVAVEKDSLLISVFDNGIGITAEALPKVFDPFVQEAHAIGFNNTGLGIGLTVVRELIEAHGGTVTASSAGTGQGSRFVITLPFNGALQ